MTIAELRQRRMSLWEQAKSLHELARAEKRELTAEEREQWDRINAEIDSLKATIDREERIAAIDAEMDAIPEPIERPQPEERMVSFRRGGRGEEPEEVLEEESPLPASGEYRSAFRDYLRYGLGGMRPERRAVIQPYYGAVDTRALGVGTAAAGGATVPEEFYRRLVDALKAFGGMRRAGTTKLSTASGATMPIPLDDDTANTGEILAEGSAATEQDITFAAKNLGSYMYSSKLVRVSIQLLQDSAFDLDSWLAMKLGQRLGRAQNAHFTTGTGTGQPEGIVTGAAQGALGAAGQTTSVTYADLVKLEHSVDPAYRELGAEWMFHDTTLAQLKQLEDTSGRLLWLPGIAVREPDTILGYRYVINQSVAPMAASAKSILFGNFSYYFIRDVMDIRVLRLEERYAEYLQVGFLAFMRSDGVFANPGGTASPVKYYQNSAT